MRKYPIKRERIRKSYLHSEAGLTIRKTVTKIKITGLKYLLQVSHNRLSFFISKSN